MSFTYFDDKDQHYHVEYHTSSSVTYKIRNRLTLASIFIHVPPRNGTAVYEVIILQSL